MATRCEAVPDGPSSPSSRSRTETWSATRRRRTTSGGRRATTSANKAAAGCCWEPAYRESSCVCVAMTGACRTCRSRRSDSCKACRPCARENASSGPSCWRSAGRSQCTRIGTVSRLDTLHVTSSNSRHLTLCGAKAIILLHRIIRSWYTHWPLMGGLLHLQRGGAWVRPQPAQSSPRCTKCNSPPINGQCTNNRIAVNGLLFCGFNVPVKGLNPLHLMNMTLLQRRR